VAEAVKSALGPKGMDKMLVDSFGDVTITSDGRTVLDEMDIQHPAAKMMVEVAKTQDDEVGDGTTTSVIITGELLSQAEDLIEKNVHPTVIIDGYRKAADKALEVLEKLAISVKPKDKKFLKKVAMTAMASKLVAENREYLAEIAASAVLQVAEKTDEGYKADVDDIKVEKKAGEALTDTKLISGIVLDKEVVHPGMPKRIEEARIALLNTALEIEKTEFDAKINIESPEQMDAFLKQEQGMLKEMVEKLISKEANVVLCQKGIDDLAQHFLARKNILAIRRVKKSDMEKLARATGGKVVTTLEDLSKGDLGYAELVEQRKIADDKMTFVEGCKDARSVTVLIRGGTERIVDEAERSIHDALCVVRDVVVEPKIVAGGGAPELEVARQLRDYGDSLPGREQLAVSCFSEALESVATTLAENAGLDPIDIISELRSRHEKGDIWAGVEVHQGKVQDMKKANVFEPLVVKKQTIKSATEAASMILKIDDIIASGKMKAPPTPPKGPGAPGMPPGAGAPGMGPYG
ncbi:thermosome subunit, partial [Candidatus Bathyarchaeota archaeon]|nr:thermosome subunit [Candidatus Bathyarchaeota archaeon]NIU81603.1 thermosome subunit [Candidatus Bathyarchaeota archaeon]NIV68248.1 thermosome subunit [Candidatus Bathyarchaeota archaeon]NIW15996.1 thermosome subunit [Candidatus Bathyarchaeota archaeon]NIW34773.1 thermosome subunit [Candidatus Bathyarchaeota archaeon]